MKHIVCIGAHPDDNELCVGGTAAKWRARGDAVRFISVTNGDKGHFSPDYIANPALLARRRLEEATAAAAVIGAEYRTLGFHDGEVYVDRPTTEALIRCIRAFGESGKGPDLVVFNRPVDYHRDHRYTSQAVLDATYMLTVPMMCPDVRHLDRMPVFAYWYDDFREQSVFRADVVSGIDAVMEQKIDMVCAHESQLFEWLPYNGGTLESVPPADRQDERRAMIAKSLAQRDMRRAARIRETGVSFDSDWRCVEAFQLCEYGSRLGPDDLKELFAA